MSCVKESSYSNGIGSIPVSTKSDTALCIGFRLKIILSALFCKINNLPLKFFCSLTQLLQKINNRREDFNVTKAKAFKRIQRNTFL